MSIFQLPTEVTHLKAWGDRQHQNAGTQQHASIANVAGDQFGNQDIRIPFQVAGNRWWLPAKSYLRIRIKYGLTTGVAIPVGTAVTAPSIDMAACLFQSCEFAIRGVTVSRLSNYVTQVDQYVQRTKQSAATIYNALDGMHVNEWDWERRHQGVSQRPHSGFMTDDYFTERQMRLAVGAATTVTVALNAGAAVGSLWTYGAAQDLTQLIKVGDTVYHPTGLSGIVAVVTANVLTVQVVTPAIGQAAYTADQVAFSRPVFQKVEQVSANEFDLLWQPPLSIFGIDHALPSMSCEIVLKGWPAPAYSVAAMSTRPAGIGYPPAAEFVPNHDDPAKPRVFVESVYFYSYQVVSDRMSDGSFFLDLEDTNCIAQNLVAADNLTQLQYLVHPSTFQLGVALQDARAGIRTSVPMAHLGYFDDSEVANPYKSALDIERLYLQYANMTFPQPDVQQTFTFGPTGQRRNYLRQQWLESQMATNQLFQPGGCETYEDWVNKGPLYVYQTQRDGDDRSTNVAVNIKLSRTPLAASNVTVNCLLFSVSRRAATIHVSNGSVTEVLIQDQ